MNIGFIGLGAMGAGMAANLVRRHHTVAVYDRADSAMRAFAARGLGARLATSPADAAQQAEVLICMLPTTENSREALFGPDGAAAHLATGSVVMDMGTGHPSALLALGEQLASLGLHLVDAPVNRAPPEAEAGTLLAMVGGEPAVVDRVIPLLECLCDTIHRMGPLGTGIRMKLANNYMSMINLVLTAEGLLLAERAGIDRDQAVSIMSAPGNGASNGQLLGIYPRKVLAGDLTPDFRLGMCLKDISLALDLGASLGLSLTLGAAARNQFALAASWGRAEQDCTAILPLLHEVNGGSHHGG
ncbi:MAG: oxidoreductase [Ideonella sp. MAG2]|nr:MAG: oxidoreductase [Ideonella sp. MAG2]